MTEKLNEFILANSGRGECQCGKCCDKGPDREAPPHSVNVHFFWVSKPEDSDGTPEQLRELLTTDYPQPDRMAGGPSYIEIGAALGSQELALRLIGLGELMGIWEVITPERLDITGQLADKLAGSGFVMCTGLG